MNFLIQTSDFYFQNFSRIFPNLIELFNAFTLIILIFLLTNFGNFLLKKKEPSIINFFWVGYFFIISYFLAIGYLI